MYNPIDFMVFCKYNECALIVERPMETVTKRKRATGDIKQRIMDAAFKVFSERGYQRATTKAIATEAGIAEGTIFNYFPTKKDILLAFFEEEVVGPLPDVFKSDSADDSVVIKNFLRNRLEIWHKRGGAFKVILSEALFDPQFAQDFRERVFRPGLEMVQDYISRSIEAGRFKKLDPKILARNLIAYAMSFGLFEMLSGDIIEADSDEQVVDTLTTVLLHGLSNTKKENTSPPPDPP
jgi:AcrR family transcriptional regulator